MYNIYDHRHVSGGQLSFVAAVRKLFNTILYLSSKDNMKSLVGCGARHATVVTQSWQASHNKK